MTTETLRGHLARIRYHQEGYLIGYLAGGEAVKGFVLHAELGLEYELHGEWETHPRFGRQFAFVAYQARYPKDSQAIADYLARNCEGIGPKTGAAIVEAYGEATFETLREQPTEVAAKVRGLSADAAKKASKHLRERESHAAMEVDVRRLFVGVRVSRRAIDEILNRYKKKAVEKIKDNPYKLIDDIHGIGWEIADAVGRNLGLDPRSDARLRAGMIYTLETAAASEGHCYLETENFANRVAKLLGIDRDPIREAIEREVFEDRVVVDGTKGQRVYLDRLLEAERSVAEHIARLQLAAPIGEPVPYNFEDLAADQNEAVSMAMRHPVSIVTGSAGTGKTTAVRRILECIDPARQVILCAPTGKAARRLQEATGRGASTIHRVLRPTGQIGGEFKFQHGKNDPIPVDVVVVDEASMVDIRLFASLISAVRSGSKLLIIGDTHQLPPVGPGAPLRDLIDSGRVPAYELTKIKRQNPGDLLLNCHRVRDGSDIEAPPDATDFFVRHATEPGEIRQVLVDIVARRLPAKYGLDPRRGDIQVISPRRTKTDLCSEVLNEHLQEALNESPKVDGTPLRVADRVIQRANDYDLGVVNGDVGTVRAINASGEPISVDVEGLENAVHLREKALFVEFENPTRHVIIPLKKNRLELAYALTVHSTQGDTYPAVVIPIHSSHGGMLMQRSLIYTAISRASRLCVLVGDLSEAQRAVRRVRQDGRLTALRMRLQRVEGHASPGMKNNPEVAGGVST